MTHEHQRVTRGAPLEHADALGRLIRRAGQRPRPPRDVEDAVRTAAHTAWRDEIARLARRRRVALAAAATVAAIAIGIGWQQSREAQPAPGIVAGTIEQTVGPVSLRSSDGIVRDVTVAAAAIRVGERLATGVDGGARVRIENAIEVRVAPETRVTLLGTNRLHLDAGAVFVDSGTEGVPLSIDTPLASVVHVGTRYQVRVTPDYTTVMVREGHVEVSSRGQTHVAGALEQLVMDANHRITRSKIPAYGDRWRWADALADPVRIDGLALARFLEWVAVETGRRLEFASDAAAATAHATTLHGSIDGMSPEQALAAVLATTDLSAELVGDQLVIDRTERR